MQSLKKNENVFLKLKCAMEEDILKLVKNYLYSLKNIYTMNMMKYFMQLMEIILIMNM